MNNFKDDSHKKRFKKHLKNNFKAPKEEQKEIEKLYEIEYQWWGEEKSFQTQEDIQSAFEDGQLEKVDSDENIQLIMRFSNPELKKWKPYLDKKTADILKEVGRRWRKEADKNNIEKDIRLAVTSLTRSVEYQKEIIEKGKLAVENSSHTKGKSFDIDGCGYYKGDEAINPRFTESYKNTYNPEVHTILKKILEKMKKNGRINFIPEYTGTTNQCFHVTRAPIN